MDAGGHAETVGPNDPRIPTKNPKDRLGFLVKGWGRRRSSTRPRHPQHRASAARAPPTARPWRAWLSTRTRMTGTTGRSKRRGLVRQASSSRSRCSRTSPPCWSCTATRHFGATPSLRSPCACSASTRPDGRRDGHGERLATGARIRDTGVCRRLVGGDPSAAGQTCVSGLTSSAFERRPYRRYGPGISRRLRPWSRPPGRTRVRPSARW